MCTYRNRKEVLLIRLLPNDVTRRAVSAGQNIISTITGVSTTHRGRVPPDHLRVMKRLTHRFAVIIVLLGYPSTEHFLDRSYCSISRVAQVNVFTLSVPVGIVGVLLVDLASLHGGIIPVPPTSCGTIPVAARQKGTFTTI